MSKSILCRYTAESPANHDELETMRRRAWTEQGILMINPSDPKLTEEQRTLLLMIAEARYGYGGGSR